MSKKLLISVLLCFFVFFPFMPLNAQWARTYGGSDYDLANSIQQTSDGGYIVAGTTRSFGVSEDEGWVLKLDSNGDIEWQRTYGGSSWDYLHSIQQTSDEGYIVAGHTHSFGAGIEEAWILKLSTNGDTEWQRTYGGSQEDCARSVQQTSDGGYIVAGSTDSFGDFGDINGWVLKLSSNGDIEWQYTYGGGTIDYASRSIDQTSDGGYVTAGWTYSFGYGEADFIVLKLSSDGDINPSCELIKSSDALIVDTFIDAWDTNIDPVDTNVDPFDTDCDVGDTDVTSDLLCPIYTLTISATTGGTTDPSPGDYTYDGGTDVTVDAIPSSGYRFTGWSGDASGTDDPITITMDSDKSIRANFEATGDGETGKKGGCFIATAAYGSPLHPYVSILRDFRDKFLMPSKLGSKLVDLYYKYSPYLAELIAKNNVLRIAVQINLLPLVSFSYSMVHFGPIVTAVVLVFIFVLPIFLISFWQRKLRRVEAKSLKPRLPDTEKDS